tara:strand:- start:411 stop:683 length:273 start_codon:yes stop_codon:yes gene_type:complete
MTSDYPELRRVGKLIFKAWEERPDAPTWAKGTPTGILVELGEEFVDLQFQAALAISQGQTRGKDQYGRVERDRVESLGTKFIYSPGGYQV